MVAWLQSLCGDYAVPQRRAMADYLAWTAAEITAHRAAIDLALQRYGGLYAAEDWLWSALRPLPRAWMLANGEPVRLGTAFWDGARLLTTGMSHTAFWRGERLPSSPFRLRSPLPQGEAA
jgi:hypothetical protein